MFIVGDHNTSYILMTHKGINFYIVHKNVASNNYIHIGYYLYCEICDRLVLVPRKFTVMLLVHISKSGNHCIRNHIQLNQLHYLSKIQRQEALWKTINIQQQIFLGANEYLLMLIKSNYGEMV
jgi:hypothetical protein